MTTQQVAQLNQLSINSSNMQKPTHNYPTHTVGAVMSESYMTLTAELSVKEALERIRLDAPVKDTIYFAYVLDDYLRLVGTVSLRDLILAQPETSIKSLMTTEVVSCSVLADASEAARLISDYDLLAVPVLDLSQRMIGIVTYDEALDVKEEDSTEDQLKLGGVGKLVGSIKDSTISRLYKMRVGWLVLLVFGNVFSGAGIAYYEDLIANMVVLVFFLPLLVDSGGNAGSQSATLVVRALATGEVTGKDWFRMLGKECTVALFLGLTMALAVASIGLWRGGPEIAVVVAATMVLIVIVGSVIGMLLPFIFTRFNLDPAAASAPLITSICDATGVLIYFSIANAFLVIPA